MRVFSSLVRSGCCRNSGAALLTGAWLAVLALLTGGGAPAAAQSSGPEAELAYSNPTMLEILAPGAGIDRRLGDDILITSPCGCQLDRYEITVSGGGDGSGPGFAANVALYDGCPDNDVNPAQMIPGTDRVVNLPDDGTHVVSITPDTDVQLPASFWIAVWFDRAGAGWFLGEEPVVGYSEDRYTIPFAVNPCEANFQPTVLYASFNSAIHCKPQQPPVVELPNPPDGAVQVLTDSSLTWNVPPTATASGTPERDPIDSREFNTPGAYEDGTRHPDEFLEILQQEVEQGIIPDPAAQPLPDVEPRTHWGFPPRPRTVAGGTSVPDVTTDDIFLWEDSSQILTINFSNSQLYNIMRNATNAVIAEHGDNFDFIGFWLNFPPHHQIGGAFYLGLENEVDGIGLGEFNNRPNFGVAGENVEGWVMMWNQANWPTSSFGVTQLVLGQEFEHRWGVFIDGMPGRPFQGSGACGRESHWNFRLDGQGSGMEMQDWEGASPAHRTSGRLSYNDDIGGVFSFPDLYLMGYVTGDEMDTMASELRFMDNNTSCSTPYDGPISTWGSADIVAANGPRVPNALVSQKSFNTAWVMIHQPNGPPTSTQLNRVVTMLNHWNQSWEFGTIGRGTMANVLDPPEVVGPCAIAYDVYLDTENPPTTLACENTLPATCNPGPLMPDTTYYWQVVGESEILGETTGPVWSFTTVPDGPDCNNNGFPDSFDIFQMTSDDCNSNGIPDECDIAACDGDPGCDDCNGNGTLDACETDCQPNGVPDDCDIASETSADCQLNGVPDECDGGCPIMGDFNDDDDVDLNDYAEWPTCATAPTETASGFGCGIFDFDDDADIDLADFQGMQNAID